jgi:hypothetical protein
MEYLQIITLSFLWKQGPVAELIKQLQNRTCKSSSYVVIWFTIFIEKCIRSKERKEERYKERHKPSTAKNIFMLWEALTESGVHYLLSCFQVLMPFKWHMKYFCTLSLYAKEFSQNMWLKTSGAEFFFLKEEAECQVPFVSL